MHYCGRQKSLNEDQGEVVPTAIGFFPGVDLEAVVPGGFEHIDAAGFHHGSDLEVAERP